MSEPTVIPQNLSILRQKLDAVDGVRAHFASNRKSPSNSRGALSAIGCPMAKV